MTPTIEPMIVDSALVLVLLSKMAQLSDEDYVILAFYFVARCFSILSQTFEIKCSTVAFESSGHFWHEGFCFFKHDGEQLLEVKFWEFQSKFDENGYDLNEPSIGYRRLPK